MLVHNLLYSGGYEDRYFSKVVIVEDGDTVCEIEHDTYNEIFGQSEEPESSMQFIDLDSYLESFELEKDEYNDEKARIEHWFKVGKSDVHMFSVDDDKVLTINLW